MTRRKMKAAILRALATTARNDITLAAGYLFEDVEEGTAAEQQRRADQVNRVCGEVAAELERRAQRLDPKR